MDNVTTTIYVCEANTLETNRKCPSRSFPSRSLFLPLGFFSGPKIQRFRTKRNFWFCQVESLPIVTQTFTLSPRGGPWSSWKAALPYTRTWKPAPVECGEADFGINIHRIALLIRLVPVLHSSRPRGLLILFCFHKTVASYRLFPLCLNSDKTDFHETCVFPSLSTICFHAVSSDPLDSCALSFIMRTTRAAQSCACPLRSKTHWVQWCLLPGKYG